MSCLYEKIIIKEGNVMLKKIQVLLQEEQKLQDTTMNNMHNIEGFLRWYAESFGPEFIKLYQNDGNNQ